MSPTSGPRLSTSLAILLHASSISYNIDIQCKSKAETYQLGLKVIWFLQLLHTDSFHSLFDENIYGYLYIFFSVDILMLTFRASFFFPYTVTNIKIT